MESQKTLRDYNISIGKMPTGKRNLITDVEGVKVGHVTINEGRGKTGVTSILPHGGNLFLEKVMASSHVINGFGKTIGTLQIEELGTIETPIILTNTLSVGVASTGLIEYMLKENKDIGVTTGTVNPVVGECNDGYLNDIREGFIKKEHVFEAIEKAGVDFQQGAIGAGMGMTCYQLKGGIGSASRIITLGEKQYTLGALVLSNFGRKEDLIINGIRAGEIINKIDHEEGELDKGSIIIVLATDIPMTERQLKRMSKRAVVGLSKTGSYIGSGSGDLVISFTTANKVKHYEEEITTPIEMLNENKIDWVFRAVGEVVEESVLNSMICGETTVGRDGNIRKSLQNYIEAILLQMK